MSDYLQESIFDYKPQEEKLNSDNKVFVFSYSKMSVYQECPLKYKFKYIDKLPEKPKKFFFIGRVIHKVLEYFFSKIPPPSLDELKEIAEKEWRTTTYYEKGYATQEYEELDLIKINTIITNFHKKHLDNKVLPFLLEYSTYVTINGYRFTIIADRIEYNSNGKITIIDYKTGKEGDRTPAQLYFYQKVCESDPVIIKKIEERYSEKVERIQVESMIYYYVENLKEIKYPRAKESEIERFWDEILSIIENINTGRFDPKPSEKSCRWCDFKDRCPIYKQSSDSNLEKICMEYIRKSDEFYKLKNEMTELEIKIVEEMKAKGKKEFISGGKKFMIEKKLSSSDILKNKDEIIRILKENNLYEKTLRPTISSLSELINDDEVNHQIKTKLKSLLTEEERLNITDI